jgi:pimeloyl-ACP methyl ester carboxylesterase
MVGAAVGVAAGVLAAGVVAERAVVRRARTAPDDPYLGENFGELPYDESFDIVTADGTRIYLEVVEARPGSERPTVVFVHGFCLDMGTFHFQRKALAAAGEHRLVCYDQPGHGRSGKLSSGEYELSALADTLREVLDRTVPTGPVVLVGHSMGGMTIMAFAERYPEMFDQRVVGTVLIATSGGLFVQTKLGLPALVGRVGVPLLPLVNGATRITGGMIDRGRRAAGDLAWLLTRRYGFGTERPSPSLVGYVERMNAGTSTDTVARYARTLFTHARYPALAALRHNPVLIIVGDRDLITPVHHSEEIRRRLPDAEFLKVPGSGHVVMLEHADEVNEALIDFLGRLGA